MTRGTAPLSAIWQNRVVGQREADPRTLAEHPDNWRVHSELQAAALAGAIEEVGFIHPPLVNVRTGHILDGHLRVARAIATGQPTIVITEVDIPAEDEGKALLTLDPLAALATPDPAKVAELVAGVQSASVAVLALVADVAASAEQVAEAAQLVAAGKSASPSHERFIEQQKSPDRPTTVKVVVAVADLGPVEDAIRATGLPNRGEALLTICASYLEQRAREAPNSRSPSEQ